MVLTIGIKGYTYFKFEDSLKAQDIEFNEISNRPTPLNTVLWTANVDADSSYFIGYYSLFDTQDQIYFNQIDKNRGEFEEIMQEEMVQRLIKLCKGWYIIKKTEEGYAFNDLRFGMFSFGDATEEFVFRYDLVYVDGTLTVSQRQPEIENAKEMFSVLWTRIKGN